MSQPPIDVSRVATPSAETLAAIREQATHLAAFAAEAKATIAALRPRGLAADLAANQVVVQPGSKTFGTITDALNSITDASQKKQYVCYIGPGTYAETVVCKPWVFLQGEGSDQTVVSGVAGMDFNAKGTVIGASNATIQNMLVRSTANGWGTFATAVAVGDAVNFVIGNCALVASDPLGGGNIYALTVDDQVGQSGSVVNVAYGSVVAQVNVGTSRPLAVLAAMGSTVLLTGTYVLAGGGAPGWGAASGGGSALTLDGCTRVEGVQFALNLTDSGSTCIANQCLIYGPVANGVVVNP